MTVRALVTVHPKRVGDRLRGRLVRTVYQMIDVKKCHVEMHRGLFRRLASIRPLFITDVVLVRTFGQTRHAVLTILVIQTFCPTLTKTW